ncbi:GAF domain-containing SpoIIE family protein phosphatase [Leptospira sp. GIMC2001]|uniref:GAF domain-containing SpoIIE family protein phosphatase n=1 Tax=Leptospira sp. GIMC2001 TaxID=1513297 RepID=UPI002349556E|nr:GAF domain-containing SpoIIE family protein phosphatase [Leptospira sp. GIMC2001]WCL50058.1 SpoIIE family protein phosphatase [Leptospira sp. GIMC2001]
MSLTHISAILNSHLDIYQLMSLIMLYSKDLLEAEASSLFLLEKEDNFLYCEIALGDKGETFQQYARLEMGRGIAGWVAQEKKSIILEDAYQDDRFDKTWDEKTGFQTKSLICVPLFVKDQLLGTLEVMNKSGDRIFDKFDLELLQTLAENAAVAITNAQQQDSLSKRLLELSLLYEFEKKITSEKDHRGLGFWVLDKVLEYLEAKSGTIYLLDEKQENLKILAARGIPEEALDNLNIKLGEGIAGWVAQERKKLLIQNLDYDPRYKKDLGFVFDSKSLITVPLISENQLLGVISINNKSSGYAFNHNDLHMLEAISYRLAISFQNYFLFRKVAQSEKEKDRAFRVMKEVLPAQTPSIKGLTIATEYIPYDQIGGDFYQFYPIGDNKIGIFIADISGHGLSAALLALMAHSMLSTFDSLVYTSPGVLLSGLNSFLYNRMAGNFLTAFFACIDTEKNTITYANAGHPYPLIRKKDSDELVNLQAKGKLIGVMPQLIYEEAWMPFEPGDKLILYTDGLLETSMNSNAIEREEDQFFANLIDICKKPITPQEIINSTMKMISKTPNFKGFQDDVTFLVIERN